MTEASPLLVVLSGPSGVGKDAVLARFKQLGRPFRYAVTATTRPPRRGEKEGAPYHFVFPEAFAEMRESGELLEWAEVYGNFYGVPRQQVKEALEAGSDVMVKVDVQGAASIKDIAPQAVLIFVAPPSARELETRLTRRNSETSVDLRRRMETADREMQQLPLFDYVVVNDEIEQAAARIDAIVTAEKCRANPRVVRL